MYLANLIVSEDLKPTWLEQETAFLKTVFASLRPYGGVACFTLSKDQQTTFSSRVKEAALVNAKVEHQSTITLLTRAGALPGAGSLVSRFGDNGNRLNSGDKIVKGPLGILWFGGGRIAATYNWHQRADIRSLVKNGRMFYPYRPSFDKGVPEYLICSDAYTGRIVWERSLGGTDPTTRIRKKGRLVVADDSLYLNMPAFLNMPGKTLRLDPATGKTLAELGPSMDQVRVVEDRLIGVSGEKSLICLNRFTGKEIWSKTAENKIELLTAGGDRIYYFDSGKLMALDVGSGKGRWSIPTTPSDLREIPATKYNISWVCLSYSDKHDVLVFGIKELLRAFRGVDGRKLWEVKEEGGFVAFSDEKSVP